MTESYQCWRCGCIVRPRDWDHVDTKRYRWFMYHSDSRLMLDAEMCLECLHEFGSDDLDETVGEYDSGDLDGGDV